jgi:FtsX-like permease family
MSRAIRVSWFRFRATLGARWGTYLSVILLICLVGGVAMGAVAGARRTQSAFPTYLADTDSSDLQVQASTGNTNFTVTQIEALAHQLAQVPGVTHIALAPNLLVIPLGSNGRPVPSAVNSDNVSAIGSENGAYFHQDRVTVTAGRMANPADPDEMVATAPAARLSGWHVGQTVHFGAYSTAQIAADNFNFITTKPAHRFSAVLTGLIVLPSQVVNDDVDRYPTYVLMTPARTRILRDSEIFPIFGLRLAAGSGGVARAEQAIIRLLPRGTTYTFHVTAVAEAQVERASKPEAIALGVFGGIAALAALLIAGLAISRALAADDDDLDVLRALGADPTTMTWVAIVGLLAAVVIGVVLAAVVAVALSPLAPIGPASQVDPAPGLAFDWTVLGLGIAVLVLVLGTLTVGLAYANAARRRRSHGADAVERPSAVVNAALRSGLPVTAVTGLRFALERGRGRTAVPVRSALVGSVLAVVVVVTTLTFASGLHTLVSRPPLYGWNWSYAISSPGGSQVPPVVGRTLDRDHDVAAWTGYSFAGVQIDGQTVPVLLARAGADLSPPILSGHALDADHQIVLGAATLSALHKKVGDTVEVTYGSPHDFPVYVPPTRLTVVGTATMPAIGSSGTLHPSMGTGAMISPTIEPLKFRQAINSPDTNLDGPDIVVVRLRPGVPASAGLASMRQAAGAATKVMAADAQGQGDTYSVLSVQRPAEIVNYQSTGATAGILAAGLAVGAVVALGLTLAVSVRRRRRDLALLKTLGFVRRQLAVAVAWQASVAAVVGVVVGVPVGIALGRWLWDLFARDINAVPVPSVPAAQIVLVAVGALVLANLVAAVPGRVAARTRTALVLRAE